MVQQHHVEGYENFCKFIDSFDSRGQPVFIFFCGSKLPNGESWCEDCQAVKSILLEKVGKLEGNSHFVYVEVGDRPTWKNPKCPFRTDPKTKLMVLPTLVRWKTPRKLIMEQCGKPELLEMLFNDDEDDE